MLSKGKDGWQKQDESFNYKKLNPGWSFMLNNLLVKQPPVLSS